MKGAFRRHRFPRVSNSILEGQLPGPAFGNRLVHFFDRHGLVRPTHTTLHVHDRTGLPETILTVFAFDETDVSARFEVKVFEHLRRDGDLPFGVDFCESQEKPQ